MTGQHDLVSASTDPTGSTGEVKQAVNPVGPWTGLSLLTQRNEAVSLSRVAWLSTQIETIRPLVGNKERHSIFIFDVTTQTVLFCSTETFYRFSYWFLMSFNKFKWRNYTTLKFVNLYSYITTKQFLSI